MSGLHTSIFPKRREAGGILLLTLGIVMILSLVAALVLRTTGKDIESIGAQKGADEAQTIAEAGVEAVLDLLKNANPPLEADDIGASVGDWLDLDANGHQQVVCSGNVITTPANLSHAPCDDRFQLNAGTNFHAISFDGEEAAASYNRPYGEGSFFVVAACAPLVDPPICAGTSQLVIRSLGTNSQGKRKLVEVVLSMEFE
jgi:hypothetical protein